MFDEHDLAVTIASAGPQISERFDDPLSHARAVHTFCVYHLPFMQPLHTTIPRLESNIELCLQSGDTMYAAYGMAVLTLHQIILGESVTNLAVKATQRARAVLGMDIVPVRPVMKAMLMYLCNILGLTDSPLNFYIPEVKLVQPSQQQQKPIEGAPPRHSRSHSRTHISIPSPLPQSAANTPRTSAVPSLAVTTDPPMTSPQSLARSGLLQRPTPVSTVPIYTLAKDPYVPVSNKDQVTMKLLELLSKIPSATEEQLTAQANSSKEYPALVLLYTLKARALYSAGFYREADECLQQAAPLRESFAGLILDAEAALLQCLISSQLLGQLRVTSLFPLDHFSISFLFSC